MCPVNENIKYMSNSLKSNVSIPRTFGRDCTLPFVFFRNWIGLFQYKLRLLDSDNSETCPAYMQELDYEGNYKLL